MAMDAARIGIWMPADRLERLRHITTKFEVSQSKLICAFCSVLTERDIADILKRFDRLGELEAELQKIADQNLLQFVRGKSVEDLEAMLAAARRAGEPTTGSTQ